MATFSVYLHMVFPLYKTVSYAFLFIFGVFVNFLVLRQILTQTGCQLLIHLHQALHVQKLHTCATTLPKYLLFVTIPIIRVPAQSYKNCVIS